VPFANTSTSCRRMRLEVKVGKSRCTTLFMGILNDELLFQERCVVHPHCIFHPSTTQGVLRSLGDLCIYLNEQQHFVRPSLLDSQKRYDKECPLKCKSFLLILLLASSACLFSSSERSSSVIPNTSCETEHYTANSGMKLS
jgi:hypothetical protein